MSTDQSSAPEGATHRNAGHYYRKIGPTWMLYGSGNAWIATACDWDFLDKNAEPLIPAWTGEDLPPVGTICEIAPPYRDHGSKVRVLCHDEGDAICRLIEGDELGDIRQYMASEVRPIRAPKQAEMEERDQASFELAGILAGHDQHIAVRDIEMAKYLYDIGYRKQVTP